MTTDTSKAPERIWAWVWSIPCETWKNGFAQWNSSMTPDGQDCTEYVRRDLFDAMQSRAGKAEAVLGLKDALVQEERRVRVRAVIARDGLRHEVKGLQAENERLREALTASVKFSDWVADQADIDMDETILTVRVMPEGREVTSKSWAAVQADARAALERKEGGT